MPTKKEKQSRRRTSFRTFGAFLTSHMMKKFTRKNKNKKIPVDNDALEAGFIDKNGQHSRVHSEDGTAASNGHIKSGQSSETTSLSGKGAYSTNLNGSFTPPGVCGLANHGSTCYINAIVQCLSNTDLLAEYFVLGQYKADLKNARKERSKKFGTSGELAEQLARIVKSLWMNEYEITMTKTLKDVMCKYAPQYKGNEQHDSQEFLLWLFDKIHEDLNIQPIKKSSFLKASFRRKKKVVENGKLVDSKELQAQLEIVPTSFIQKVFQAHFRSTLTCPNCKRQSHTMDPSLCVSLPIRQRNTRPVYVNVTYLNSKRRENRKKSRAKTLQIGVAVPLDGKVLHLRQLVAAECGIHSRLLTFVEFDEKGFGKSYGDDIQIDKLPQVAPSLSKLYAFEMPAPMKMTAGTLPRNFASRHKKRASYGDSASIAKDVLGSPQDGANALPKNIVIILTNKKSDGKTSKVFGRPLIFHVTKDVLGSDFRSLIMTKMSDCFKKSADTEKLASSMELEVIDGLPDKPSISSKSTQPLLTPTVEMALQNCAAGGPLHVKLTAQWEAEVIDAMFENITQDAVEEHESVRLQRLLHQQPVTCTLQECFELLTKEEELGPENAWDCPYCHKQRQGTVKKLSLYTLPDVLVVHLKRFRVVNDKRTKLNTRVDFPIMGLDLTPYLLESSRPKASGQQNGGFRINGLRNFGAGAMRNEDCMYDLYAVCNHFGSLNSGHYTASCLNPLDGQWYNFDDRKTELVSEENLSQQSVYILFYQRRSINPSAPCAGGSVSSLAMSDHWAMNLQQPSRQKASSQSRLNEYAVNLSASTPMKPVSNGIGKYHGNSNNSNNSKRAGKEFPRILEQPLPQKIQPALPEINEGSPRILSSAAQRHTPQKLKRRDDSSSPRVEEDDTLRHTPQKSKWRDDSSSPLAEEDDTRRHTPQKSKWRDDSSSPRVEEGATRRQVSQASEYSRPQKPRSVSKNSRNILPNGRRYSGSYDIYRKEREAFIDNRRGERGRNGVRNRDFSPQPYETSPGYYGNYDNDFVFATDIPPNWNAVQHYPNGVQHMIQHPQIDPFAPPGQHAFVRGVPKQQSVPRSVSKAERAPVNTRRLSERHHRQRPSSQYDPYVDTYKRTTYF